MASVFFNNPVVTDTRSAVLQYIRDATQSQARMFDGDTLNAAPTGTIRWSSANNRFEIWNGSVWSGLGIGRIDRPASQATFFAANASLGTAAGDRASRVSLTELYSGNHNQLDIYDRRSDAGSDWSTTATIINRKIDSTEHGFIAFGKIPGVAGTEFNVSLGFQGTNWWTLFPDGAFGPAPNQPTARLWFGNQGGVAGPSFSTRSIGTKIVLFPELSASAVDYAIGIEGGTMWFSVPTNSSLRQFMWYAGTTAIAALRNSASTSGQSFTVDGTADPLAATARFAFNATGSYGGGYRLIDGGQSHGIWAQGGDLSFGHSASAEGTMTRRAFMRSNGAWSWATDVWHTSNDGNSRFYFAGGGTAFLASPNEIIFRPGYSNADDFRFAAGGQMWCRGTSPTTWWHDTDHRSFAIHVNSDLAYFMRGGTNDPNWTQITDFYGTSRWMMTINLSDGRIDLAGRMRVYNFFEAAQVIGIRDTGASPFDGNGTTQIEAQGTGGSSGATMSFHRPGNYAIKLGLDSDNKFKLGGWSRGAGTFSWIADTNGDFYSIGLLFGRNGGRGMGQITLSTGAPSGGANGDIHLRY